MKAIFAAAKRQQQQSEVAETIEEPQEFKFSFNLSDLSESKKKKKKKNRKKKSTVGASSDTAIDQLEEGEESDCSDGKTPCRTEDVKSSVDSTPALETAAHQTRPSALQKQTNIRASEITIEGKELQKDKKETSADAKKKKKPKNKPKKKSSTDIKTSEFDDFDAIIQRVVEINKKNEQFLLSNTHTSDSNSSPNMRPPPGLSKVNEPRFMSPNDPGLDSRSRLFAKYGQGKNLVATGPRRMRDPFWLRDHISSDYENQIAASMAEVVLDDTAPVSQQHTSFAFSFGGFS